MSDVILDVAGSTFVLSGNIAPIRDSRRAKSHFESIDACFDDDGKIILAFGGEGQATFGERYRQIKKLLDNYRIDYKETASAQSSLGELTQSKKDFEEFSKKARDIRSGQHEGEDFNDFVKIMDRDVERNLYDLQLLSAYHLAFAQNACNFSVPGAGKTSIVYGAYAYLKSLPSGNRKHVKRMLIICPLAAFAPWENEYEECFGKKPSIKKLVGVTARERANHFISTDGAEITLISYQSATQDVEHIHGYLTRYGDVMVVLDEAHKIKNTDEDAKWATAIKSLASAAKARVVLTGTPVLNGYEDLWNLYKFIWPDYDIIKFRLENLAEIETIENKEILVKRISPFFIRIKKKDLGLPEPEYHAPLFVPMDRQQRAIYNYISEKYIESFDGDGLVANLKKAKIMRWRQCLTNPALLKKSVDGHFSGVDLPGIDDRQILQAILDYESTPQKFIAAGNLVERILQQSGADGKVIIWAYFIENIKSLQTYLTKRGIPCEKLYGATPSEGDDTRGEMETREKIIRDFHKGDCRYKVIIANPFAVGESISLHKACHNAIYLEKDFNAAHYMQSKDRIHRYGLKDGEIVHYYYLVTENSIDEVIHERVLEKEAAMLDIVERDEIPLLKLNMDENDDADENDIRAIIKWYRDRKSA